MLCSMGFAEGHVHAALKSFLAAAREHHADKPTTCTAPKTNLIYLKFLERTVHIVNASLDSYVCKSLLLERLQLNPSCKAWITSGVVCLAHEESKVIPYPGSPEEKWRIPFGNLNPRNWSRSLVSQ